MARAVCTGCGAVWFWRARRGARLAELRCTDCGKRLRAPHRGETDNRLAFDLGKRRSERIAYLHLSLDGMEVGSDQGPCLTGSMSYPAMIRAELDRLERSQRDYERTPEPAGGPRPAA